MTSGLLAQMVREQRNPHGRPMQTFEIDGRTIKTNLRAWQNSMWDGNDVPEKYNHPNGSNRRLGFGESEDEAFEKAFIEGYTEIRFVETSTCIRGYHHVYVWCH